jgi:hypothetical protein
MNQKYNYYLVLKFENAGWFSNDISKGNSFKKSRPPEDYYKDNGVLKARSEIKKFVEPITAQQISNMIHVLFGERPKPMNRHTFYDKKDYLYQKALDSYLIINQYKNDNGLYFSEKIKTKKSHPKPWSNPFLTWEIFEKYLTKENFDKFVSLLNDEYKLDYKKVTYISVRKQIMSYCANEKFIEFFNDMRKLKKSAFERVIRDPKEFSGKMAPSNSELTRHKESDLYYTVFSGVDNIVRLSGKIMVPVSKEDIEILRKNKGCATLLDGGVVTIEELVGINRVSVNGFTKVSDISLEMQ